MGLFRLVRGNVEGYRLSIPPRETIFLGLPITWSHDEFDVKYGLNFLLLYLVFSEMLFTRTNTIYFAVCLPNVSMQYNFLEATI